MKPIFSFCIFLQSKGSEEDTTGTEEEVGNAVRVSGQLVSLGKQEHRSLVHRAYPRSLWPWAHGLLSAEERHMEGVLGGEELDFMGQVERGRGGLGEAAFPSKHHLGIDEVEATGRDQE